MGARGQALPHSAMALVNVAYNISYGWTKPELQSLEAQMLEPLLNDHPVELGLAGREQTVYAQLAGDASYRAAFAAAFPKDPAPMISLGNIVKAIATYERTLISGRSPFDKYVFDAEHDAISPQAKRGMALFYSPRGACSSCHSGFNFEGNWRDAQGDTGKASFANNGTGARMRVPTLRNIALTAPYMHDGRFATLDAVLEHYAQVAVNLRAGQRSAPALGGGAEPDVASATKLRTFDLSRSERSDLIAFLHTLTDAEFVNRYSGR
jgi:cytochrome c peroxidase